MRNGKSKRTAPAALTLAACVALLGTFATMEHADARGIRGLSGRPPLLDSAPSIQPHFNPSNSIHGAAIARDACFAGKSRVGLWAALSAGIN